MESNQIILLIEDNVDDERLTLRALRKNNIMNEVVVAYDGEEALSHLFDEAAELPAVVILDLKLPKVSGLEVLRKIRESSRTQLIPIVVVTASDDEAQIDKAYELGANSFIRKPTDPEEFSEMVLQLAMYWLLLNRGPKLAPAV